MAKQTQGILGVVKGKIGNVVGAQWKQSPYFRSYSVPANPNTTAQQAQRAKMAFLVWNARLILGSVINSYITPFQKAMSGYNRFVQMNIKNLSNPPTHDELLLSEGQLEPTTSITTATYATATGDFQISWNNSVLANGDAADSAVAVIIDTVNRRAWVFDAEATRNDGDLIDSIASGLTLADLAVYVFFHRGDGDMLMVSPSVYSEVEEP